MIKYDIKAIGERIAMERRRRKISQEEFIEMLGNRNISIGRNRLSSIENGKRDKNGNPPDFSIRELIAFCDILQCDASYLLGEHDEKTVDKHYICQKTGLTETAIDYLLPHSQDWQIGVLNLVLEEYPHFLRVLAGIYDYYIVYAQHEDHKKTFERESRVIRAKARKMDGDNWAEIFKIETGRSVTNDRIKQEAQLVKVSRFGIYESFIAMVDKIITHQYEKNLSGQKGGQRDNG